MQVGDTEQTVDFEVIPDPRSSATPEDYAAQFAFVMEARDLLSRTHREVGRIRSLREQLTGVQARLEAGGDDAAEPSALLADIRELQTDITAIEEALYQTKNQSRQDPLNFPVRLNNKLTSLMRGVAQGDARPTRQALAVKAELSGEIEAQLVALQRIWEGRVPAVNDKVRAQGLDMIYVESI